MLRPTGSCAGVLVLRTNLDSFGEVLAAALVDLEELLASGHTSDPKGGYGRVRSRDVLHSIIVITLYMAPGNAQAPSG